MYLFTALEARCLKCITGSKSRCWWGHVSFGGSWVEHTPCLFQFLVAPSLLWLGATSSTLSLLHMYMTFSSVCLWKCHLPLSHKNGIYLCHSPGICRIIFPSQDFKKHLFNLVVSGLSFSIWGLHWCAGSAVAVCGLSCPAASGILVPWPGIKPVSPAFQGRLLTTAPPEKFLRILNLITSAKTLPYKVMFTGSRN